MHDLRRYFEGNTGRMLHKWTHYFEVYERHLERYRGTDVHVVEIGVYQGGSLQMWKSYFGDRARIHGVDVHPDCRRFEEERVRVLIGDQGDRDFLRRLARELPRIDVLIDDGGHAMQQQIATFEELFPHVAPDGVYICEDTHTSYWDEYGGGYRRPGTFMEYSKALIDQLNAWHSREPDAFAVSDFTRSAHAMHFYDSLVVVEKRPMSPPQSIKTGTATLPEAEWTVARTSRADAPADERRRPWWRR
jgi:hypothetical protein